MPTLDKSLKGSKVFYLFNDQTGGGFKYQKFTVTGAKKPKRADAAGQELKNPMFKYTLAIGSKGESITTKLPAAQYGTNKKWYMAVKQRG